MSKPRSSRLPRTVKETIKATLMVGKIKLAKDCNEKYMTRS
jgi:hypothetical protein